MNNVAQIIEVVHCAYHSAHARRGAGIGAQEEDISYEVKAGRGIGSCDPAGILFHDYTFDENGRCIAGNAIIPTSQNINNVEQDMKAFVRRCSPPCRRRS